MTIDETHSRLPNFFILGGAKCGTTSLAYYLSQHPDIFVPREEEPHFFDSNRFYQKGLSFYARYFYRDALGSAVRIDATPAYFHKHRIVIPRLKRAMDSARIQPKFVILLRDPVDRAVSHYRHMVRIGKEELSFQDALLREQERMKRAPNSWYGYYMDGLYAKQLNAWFQAFDRERFLLIRQEDLKSDPESTLTRIYAFADIRTDYQVSDLSIKNQASKPRSMLLMKLLARRWPRLLTFWFPLPWKRRLKLTIRKANLIPSSTSGHNDEIDDVTLKSLRRKYGDEIRRLEIMTGWSLEHWLRD